jgi:hypothetical protein
MSRLKILTLVAMAVWTAACSGSTATTPTTTTPSTVTDTYSGTLSQNGAANFSFTTAQSGNVQTTLIQVVPDSTLVVGLSLGTWNGTSCQVVLANDKATRGSSIVGTASAAGTLCVRIYDVGNVIDPITFQLQVTHF